MSDDRKLQRSHTSEFCPEPRRKWVEEFEKPKRFRKVCTGKLQMLCSATRADGQLCTRAATPGGRCTTPGHGGRRPICEGDIQPKSRKWANPLWLEYKRRKLDRILTRMGKLDREREDLKALIKELTPEVSELVSLAKQKKNGDGFQVDENFERVFKVADKLYGRIIQLEETEGKIRRMVGNDVTLEDFAAIQRLYKMWILGHLEEIRPEMKEQILIWLRIQKKKGLLSKDAMPEKMVESVISTAWDPVHRFRRKFARALKMGELLTPRMKQLMRPDPDKGDVMVKSRKQREAELSGSTD